MTITEQEIRKAVKVLKQMDLTPKCANHQPEKSGPGVINCRECGFTMIYREEDYAQAKR